MGSTVINCHGTDSGYARSSVYRETYGNSVSNSLSVNYGVSNSRGGIDLFFGNSFGGSSVWQKFDLQYYRVSLLNLSIGTWGIGSQGLNWIPLSAIPGNGNSVINSLNAADFISSHSYAALAVVGPLTNNAGGNFQGTDHGGFNFQLTNGPCISGSYPSSWNQTLGGTTTDSAGCTWKNVGGTTTTGLSIAGWCTANPDTLAAANSVCAALQAGDTASRYFENTNGTYPFRDQPCVGHNQVVMPCYEWMNTGTGLSQIFGTDSGSANAVQQNRDYFDYVSSGFNGAVGVGSGTLAPPFNMHNRRGILGN